MKKKKRNPQATVKDYKKYYSSYNGNRYGDTANPEYYGLIKKDGRVKIDIKRMKKVKTSGIPDSILDAASSIHRNTTYFLPLKIHRQDYIVNQFRDKLTELQKQWAEFKHAFTDIQTPEQKAENIRTELISTVICDPEEASVNAVLKSTDRIGIYKKLRISQCAQFIHQMATELDALMLRKCVYLGYAQKTVTRNEMFAYINGTQKGKYQIEALPHFRDYRNFFLIWNMLKHNSEDLFDKVKLQCPEMLLTNQYRNGEMSMYYMKIDYEYIEKSFSRLLPFYEEFCEAFFGEKISESNWNYDDYFISAVNKTIDGIVNPLNLKI